MKVLIAKTSGFCMGVRRAVEMVLDAPDEHANPIFTYGPLIHNPQVLNLLREKDIRVMKEIPAHGSGTVLIRAHGVPPSVKQQLTQADFKVIDKTLIPEKAAWNIRFATNQLVLCYTDKSRYARK